MNNKLTTALNDLLPTSETVYQKATRVNEAEPDSREQVEAASDFLKTIRRYRLMARFAVWLGIANAALAMALSALIAYAAQVIAQAAMP